MVGVSVFSITCLCGLVIDTPPTHKRLTLLVLLCLYSCCFHFEVTIIFIFQYIFAGVFCSTAHILESVQFLNNCIAQWIFNMSMLMEPAPRSKSRTWPALEPPCFPPKSWPYFLKGASVLTSVPVDYLYWFLNFYPLIGHAFSELYSIPLFEYTSLPI